MIPLLWVNNNVWQLLIVTKNNEYPLCVSIIRDNLEQTIQKCWMIYSFVNSSIPSVMYFTIIRSTNPFTSATLLKDVLFISNSITCVLSASDGILTFSIIFAMISLRSCGIGMEKERWNSSLPERRTEESIIPMLLVTPIMNTRSRFYKWIEKTRFTLP